MGSYRNAQADQGAIDHQVRVGDGPVKAEYEAIDEVDDGRDQWTGQEPDQPVL
jgi:hypothetical protein